MSDPTSKLARPASVDDLKLLLRALDQHQVDYLLIGGYALYARPFSLEGEGHQII